MEKELRQIVDGLPGQVVFMAPTGELEFANLEVLTYFGKTLEDLKGWASSDAVHPDDLPDVLEAWARAIGTGAPYDIEHRMRRADGVYRWFHVRMIPSKDAAGTIVRWTAMMTEVEDLKRAQQLLAGEVRLLEMVARGRPLHDVLPALCALVERVADGCLSSILLVDPDGSTFRLGAGPSLPDRYNALLDGKTIDPSYGPCSLAATSKTPAITPDLANDPRWAGSEWPALMEFHGLRSCWSLPIVSVEGAVLGVFAVYRREPGDPTDFEHDLIGRFANIAGIAIERAQSDAALKHSEARKAAILDSSLDCIVTIDHQGRITEFNPAAELVFGYRRQEVLGAHMAEVIVPPALRERHYRGMQHYLVSGKEKVIGRRVEMTAMRADGSEFPVELTISRIATDGPPTFSGHLRDITERKRAEEQLRRSQAYLAEAQRLSLTGSFGWRPAGDEHFWSEQTFRIFDLDRSVEPSLQLVLERVHPEDAALIRQVLAAAEQGADLDFGFRLLSPDQSVKHLLVVAHATEDPDGRLEYIGAVQDVTEQRLSEEALSMARAELAHVARIATLSALTASIAHEVNQPLAGIITNASTCLRMLAADPPNLDGARATAQRTIRDGNRASEVIQRLRAMFANRRPSTEQVDLNDAARELVSLCASELQRRSVIVRTDFAEDMPAVSGDRVQLQQVMLNLILNAADAMSQVEDRPRDLWVATRFDEDQVKLSVRDVGMGIEPQNLGRLFDTFYTTKAEGMGVGLSISRSIVEGHDGRLWASANDGPGTTFSFSIPCRNQPATNEEISGASTAHAGMDAQHPSGGESW